MAFIRRYKNDPHTLILTAILIVITVIGALQILSPQVENLIAKSNQQIRFQSIIGMLSLDFTSMSDTFQSSRLERFEDAWPIIQKSPWFGNKEPTKEDTYKFTPHNIFLLIWERHGFFILLFFVYINALLFYGALYKRISNRLYILLILSCVYLQMLFNHGLFDKRFNAIIFTITLLSYCFSSTSLSGDHYFQSQRSTR